MPDYSKFEHWRGLGFSRLLPIVPPGARVEGHGNPGKTPGLPGEDGSWRGLRGWSKLHASQTELGHWQAWGAGVGLLATEDAFAIDVDAHDPELSAKIEGLASALLGPAPKRVGRAPKFALLYRCIDKLQLRVLRFETTPERKAADAKALDRVEIPGQLVIGGMHPVTLQPYSWPLPPGPADELTPVSAAKLDFFFHTLRSMLPVVSGTVSSIDRANVEQDRLRGDRDAVAAAVRKTPNDSRHFRYEEWVRYAAAIRAALPDDEDFGLELFQEFSARTDLTDLTEDPERVYWSVQPPFGVGADYLQQTAHKLSDFSVGQHFRAPDGPGSPQTDEIYFSDETPARISPPPATHFACLDMDELLAYPEREFLIQRFVPQGGLGIMYGMPGSYKSFIALDMALHLVYGLHSWWDDAEIKAPGAIVYVTGGEGVHGYGARIKTWREHHGCGSRKRRFGLIPEPTNFMKPEDIGKLVATVDKAFSSHISLTIVDTVSRSIPGADENLQKEMSLFVSACDALRQRFGCAAMGVHHESRGGNLRGSTVFDGACDFILHTKADKEQRQGQLWIEKQKDGVDNYAVPFSMQHTGASLAPLIGLPADVAEALPVSLEVLTTEKEAAA